MKASTLIENAACASQNRELLEGGKLYDHVLRNVFDPMQSRITALEAERDRRGLPALGRPWARGRAA